MTTLERYDSLVSRWLHAAVRGNLTQDSIENYTSTARIFREFLQGREEQGIIGSDYVSFDDVLAWADAMTDAGNKPSTVRQRLIVIGQFFTFACKPYIPQELRYPQSPVSPDFYPKVIPEQVPEILPDDAVTELWTYKPKYSATEGKFARNYALVVLILTTGLRNKEVLDLALSDVDFAHGEISVACGKGRKFRVVDMPRLCAAALENYLRSGERPSSLPDSAYLFGTTAAHVYGDAAERSGAEPWHRGSTGWLSQLIARHVRNQTGFSGVTSHDLRHLFARLTLNATGNLAELQGAMGHTSPVVTERYSGRLMQRRKRDSARAVLAARDAAAELLEKRNTARKKIVSLYA